MADVRKDGRAGATGEDPAGLVDWSRLPSAQAPGQWAIRWHATVLFLACLAVAPLTHFHRMATATLPSERYVRAAAEWQWDGVMEGRWTTAVGTWLEKDNPAARALTGSWNDLRWRLGILQNEQVHVGAKDWFYLRNSLAPSAERIESGAESRRQVLEAVAARTRRLGVHLVVLLVPDKERIYPEYAYADGQMPSPKHGLYARIIDDLKLAGIPVVDVARVMHEARPAPGPGNLYYQRDTHWTVHGAFLAAQALRRHLETSPLRDQLGREVLYAVPQPMVVSLMPDLVALCGLRTFETRLEGMGEPVLLPASVVSSQLSESKQYWRLRTAAIDVRPGLPMDALADEALVALAGSSFSAENGKDAVAFALGRALDGRGIHKGASALQGLAETLDRMEQGESKARVLVWEFVERAWLEGVWVPPAGLLRH